MLWQWLRLIWILIKFYHYCRRILTRKSHSWEWEIVRRFVINMQYIILQRRLHHEHQVSMKNNELQVGSRKFPGFCNWSMFRRNFSFWWSIRVILSGNTKHFFFYFSAWVSFWSLKLISEWSRFRRWSGWNFLMESESIWFFIRGEKTLRSTWKQFSIVGTNICANLREIQFHNKISESSGTNFYLRNRTKFGKVVVNKVFLLDSRW